MKVDVEIEHRKSNAQNWIAKHVWGVEGNGIFFVATRIRFKHLIGSYETHSRCSLLKSKFPGGKGKEAMEKATMTYPQAPSWTQLQIQKWRQQKEKEFGCTPWFTTLWR